MVLTKTGSTQPVRIVMKNSQIVASATVPGATVSAQQELEVADNLSQIMNATDQYFLQTGANSVTFDTLFAGSQKPPSPVAGENYTGMVIKQGGEIRVSLSDGSTVYQLPHK